MKEKSIASRYAKALFDIAEEKNSLDAFLAQWQLLVETIRSLDDVKNLLESRLVPKDAKKDLIKTLFSQSADPLLMAFFFFLIDKGRENYLDEILLVLQELIDEKNDVLNVKIASALPLAEKQRDDLISAIGKTTGKKIQLDPSVDHTLIGGLVMTINDTVYDGSIRGQLSLLKQQLAAGSDKI